MYIKKREEAMQIQKENNKPIRKMIYTKILGIVLLTLAILLTISIILTTLSIGWHHGINVLLMTVFTYIIGTALILIKKRGTIYTYIVIFGIIILMYYVYMLILMPLLWFFRTNMTL